MLKAFANGDGDSVDDDGSENEKVVDGAYHAEGQMRFCERGKRQTRGVENSREMGTSGNKETVSLTPEDVRETHPGVTFPMRLQCKILLLLR